jgi:hypothetical protein
MNHIIHGRQGDANNTPRPILVDAQGRVLVVLDAQSAAAKVIAGSFTRPGNTTAYAAGEVITAAVAAAIEFADAARSAGGGGRIVAASLLSSANQGTKLDAELWLFDTTITPDADNAAWTPSDAELATLVAIIPFQTWYVGDATSGSGGNAVAFAEAEFLRSYVCTATSLYGVLVARNAYTPVNAEVFTVRLHLDRD